MTSYLDNPDLDAAYLKEWKMRRDEVAFLMRRLDVRTFELAPNVSLSAIRAYGDDEITDSLNLSTAGPSVASSAISSSAFFRALVGKNQSNVSTLKSTRDSAANEYRRVQSLARKKDKQLNKALSSSIQRALEDEETDFTVRTEKQAPDSNLEPDILVTSEDGVAVCIEATWRSTGEKVEGELESRQSTLTVGHVQKYMLEKVLEYVKDLGF